MKKGPFILVVSDHKPILKLLRVNLSSVGYDVITGTDATSAIGALKENEAALVVFDVTMPCGESLEALGRVRQRCNVPIIMLTTRNEVAGLRHSLLGPQDEYIVKPFDIQKLLDLVKTKLAHAGQ